MSSSKPQEKAPDAVHKRDDTRRKLADNLRKRGLTTSPPEECARFGIEISPPILHIEADTLVQVLSALKQHSGRVRVFDRDSTSYVIEGSLDEVRQALLCRYKTVVRGKD